MSKTFRAVIWDFGGVITSSPFDAFNRHEAERGLPHNAIRGINARNPDTNAWARLERDELDAAGFDTAFAAEAEEVSPDKTLAEATLSVRGSNGDFTCTWSGAAEERTDESATVTSAGSCTDENGDTFDFSGTATAR